MYMYMIYSRSFFSHNFKEFYLSMQYSIECRNSVISRATFRNLIKSTKSFRKSMRTFMNNFENCKISLAGRSLEIISFSDLGHNPSIVRQREPTRAVWINENDIS